MIFITISIFLFIPYAILIIFYRWNWLNCNEYKIRQPGKVFISVIIPARNEEKNIGNCLNSLLAQTYPSHSFEVLVADDFSTDNTATIVASYSKKNIRTVSLKDHIPEGSINSYKKKAIEIAIGEARGDLILTTDADCILPPRWIELMSSFYADFSPAFICAPVAFHYNSSFLSIFQALDFMTLQGITGASVNNNFHNMCNGANLAYEKKAFYDVNGFAGVDTIASGDDMLLMSKIAAVYPERILYLKSREAIVTTMPMLSTSDFLNQRIRWASKTGAYKDKKIMGVLVLVYFCNVWLLVVGIASIFYHSFVFLLLSLLFGKILIELFFLYPVSTFFNNRKLLWYFPIAQPFHIIYTVVAGWLGKFGSYQWKGRKVH